MKKTDGVVIGKRGDGSTIRVGDHYRVSDLPDGTEIKLPNSPYVLVKKGFGYFTADDYVVL